MKKFLLTAALVLALVTSLTAGTMAFYSATVETIEANVTTKTFSITADKLSATINNGVKIAPGDTAHFEVTVNNASEVGADTTVEAALSKTFPGMNVMVGRKVSDNGNETLSGSTAQKALARMGVGTSDVYTITVTWPYDEDFGTETPGYAGQALTLSVDISGKQVNENRTIQAN